MKLRKIPTDDITITSLLLFNSSINRACRGLAEPDIRVSDAVEVRRELDLRIGILCILFILCWNMIATSTI